MEEVKRSFLFLNCSSVSILYCIMVGPNLRLIHAGHYGCNRSNRNNNNNWQQHQQQQSRWDPIALNTQMHLFLTLTLSSSLLGPRMRLSIMELTVRRHRYKRCWKNYHVEIGTTATRDEYIGEKGKRCLASGGRCIPVPIYVLLVRTSMI